MSKIYSHCFMVLSVRQTQYSRKIQLLLNSLQLTISAACLCMNIIDSWELIAQYSNIQLRNSLFLLITVINCQFEFLLYYIILDYHSIILYYTFIQLSRKAKLLFPYLI